MSKRVRFDQTTFDRKSFVPLPTELYADKKFEKWLTDYDEHLKVMYGLSGLDCDFLDFSTYVYQNSD